MVCLEKEYTSGRPARTKPLHSHRSKRKILPHYLSYSSDEESKCLHSSQRKTTPRNGLRTFKPPPRQTETRHSHNSFKFNSLPQIGLLSPYGTGIEPLSPTPAKPPKLSVPTTQIHPHESVPAWIPPSITRNWFNIGHEMTAGPLELLIDMMNQLSATLRRPVVCISWFSVKSSFEQAVPLIKYLLSPISTWGSVLNMDIHTKKVLPSFSFAS
jgi:hypothetical protein